MAADHAKILFLWHLHQPNYKSPETDWYVLPWVRLHASCGYLDLISTLFQHEAIQTSLNVTPILLQQLKDYEEQPHGSHMELTLKDASHLSDEEQDFLLKHFFSAYADTQIKSLPRLWELFLKRGTTKPIYNAEMPRRLFRARDFRDLQVLFNLAWCGFTAQEDTTIASLMEKGRDFSEEDKPKLIERQIEFAQRVHAMLVEGAKERRFELLTSPYFHPILPLLIDSDSARPGLPQHDLPQPPFCHPEDAELQVELALAYIKEALGTTPAGMWPSEGSVSEAALEVLARAGVKFVATDAGILRRSLDIPHLGTKHLSPWRYETPAGPVTILFRDTKLSDAISFLYKDMTAQDAVDDFMRRVRALMQETPGSEPALITIVLDGENPWPYYPEFAREFMHRLFDTIEQAPDITAEAMGDAIAEYPQGHIETLPRVFPGSWIASNFRIWIGDQEKNAAWELLESTRSFYNEFLEKHPDYAAGTRMGAYNNLLAAEGSDWFWWYGETAHATDELFFDMLFRSHLASVYRLLNQEVPDMLDIPIIRKQQFPDQIAPTDVMSPHVDGKVTGFYEWEAAGSLMAENDYTAMAKAAPTILQGVYFGYTSEVFHLRADFVRPARDVSPDYVLVVRFTDPVQATISLSLRQGEGLPFFVYTPVDGGGRLEMSELSTFAVDDIAEVSIPFGVLGLPRGEWAYFRLELYRDGKLIEAIPSFSSIGFQVPTEDYEMEMWFEGP